MKGKLSVAFLWHMHQPLYKDLVTGKYHLPWVRLHSTYSYLDMASVLKDFTDIKCTFNITPSLLWQLRDISANGDIDDIYLHLSYIDARDLTDDDRCFLLKNFFSCDPHTAIYPVKRYAALFEKRGSDLDRDSLLERSSEFSVQEYRDLQVLFNLAWCGFTLRREDRLVKDLVAKGSDYTEEEKKNLLNKQKEVTRSIIPLYRELQDQGRIEISTTPFYHPILPLLCDGGGKGFDFGQDARIQVDRAVEFYEDVFGRPPAGMWPSEGSVSPEIIPILSDAGIKWMATDEGILIESFRGGDISRKDLIYKAFTASNGSSSIDMVFRDINISNAIGFRYSKIPPHKAALDLCGDIQGIKKSLDGDGSAHIVPIILDGENPWPYYNDGGRKFLRELYSHLSHMKDVETVTIGGYLSSCGEKTPIPDLYSGSWIDRNFRKWSASPQKDKAWEYLARVRKDLFASGEPSAEALEELYIAEGSDWFWWYDEFGTELNFIFDELFRLHLSNIYKLMGRPVPHYLEEPLPMTPAAQRLPDIPSGGEMARSLNILFVSSEVEPFAKTGGLADVAGSLPSELLSMGCDVRVIMPFYGCVARGEHDLKRAQGELKSPLNVHMPAFELMYNRTEGLTTYFLKNDGLFDRPYLYGGPGGDYPDNALRFGSFCEAVLAAVEKEGFKPDLIHCNDWQTALIPFYLKYSLSEDGFFRRVKTLFTIHNLAYQGIFGRKVMKPLGIPESFFNINDLEFYGNVNFMKSGILYSDAVSTVSHRYAEEIMSPRFGAGLDGLIRSRKDVLYGIPNGVDYSVWSPRNDTKIKSRFGPDSVEKKMECKKDLIEYTGLDILPEMPLIGAVTRLVEQKGMDLFAAIIDKVIKLGAGVVVLGKGDEKHNRLFSDIASKYPGKVHVCNDFNDDLAHKIEAGADIFVMPSRYEPCGLNQMYSVKYGTIPVVRATGGLDDVIVDFDEDRELGNGFKFSPATSEAFFRCLKRAIDHYHDRQMWNKLVLNAMKCDFSWSRSAEKYLALYRKIVG
jgi:starch synthase